MKTNQAWVSISWNIVFKQFSKDPTGKQKKSTKCPNEWKKLRLALLLEPFAALRHSTLQKPSLKKRENKIKKKLITQSKKSQHRTTALRTLPMKATDGGSGHPADMVFFHGRSDGSNSKQPKAWEELRSNSWTRLWAVSQQPNTCLLQTRCHRVQWGSGTVFFTHLPPSTLPLIAVPRSQACP